MLGMILAIIAVLFFIGVMMWAVRQDHDEEDFG